MTKSLPVTTAFQTPTQPFRMKRSNEVLFSREVAGPVVP